MMGQSEFGLYSLVASIIAYLTLLDFGISNGVIRYTAKLRAEGETTKQYEMFGMFISIYCLLSFVVILVGAFFIIKADDIFSQSMTLDEIYKMKIMLIILLFNLAFTLPMSVFSGIITAYEDFIFVRLLTFLRIVFTTILMIILLEMGYKAIAMVVVNTIFNFLFLLTNYIYVKYKYKIQIIYFRFKREFIGEFAIYSFWIFLNAIMDKVYWTTGQFVIGVYVSTSAVAIYMLSIHLQSAYMQFSTAISSLFLPKITTIATKQGSKIEISNMFLKVSRVQYIILGVIFWVFLSVGKEFIQLWLGKDYDNVYYISAMFLGALVIPLTQNIGIVILQARNQMKFRSLLCVSIAIICLIFQIVLTKFYGIYGSVFPVVIMLIIGQGLILNIYYKKVQHIDIGAYWKSFMRLSIVPLLLCILCIYVKSMLAINSWVVLFAYCTSFLFLYYIISYLISFNSYEKSLIRQFISKIRFSR